MTVSLQGAPETRAGGVAAPGTVPTASVVIVNYNGRAHIQRCLQSLLKDDGQEHEIIVVDNGSTDGSAQYVEEAFPEVLLIRNQANLGFARGSNVGARHASGQYVAFLNQDTMVDAGWLQPLVAALEADSEAALATSKILLSTDPGRVNTCGNEVHLTGLTLCRGMGAHRDAFPDRAEVSAISGAALAVRRDVFDALGGFDETFFMYMEDTDLSWRARLAGYRCLYVPQSVVYHDYALRFGPLKTYYQERNRYLILLKHLRWRTLLVLLPALLLGEAVTWGFVLLRERRRWASKLRAYGWVAQHWGHIMRTRRQVQTLRRVRDRDLIRPLTHRLAYEQIGDDASARLAHAVFDPLFQVLRRLALAVVRW